MSGTLAYAREFRKGEFYKGRDGGFHYEVVAEDGDMVSLSNIKWEQVKGHGLSLGIPEETWPQYPSPIDIDLDDLAQKNQRLRNLMVEIHEPQVSDKGKLHQIWMWVREGKQIFFSET